MEKRYDNNRTRVPLIQMTLIPAREDEENKKVVGPPPFCHYKKYTEIFKLHFQTTNLLLLIFYIFVQDLEEAFYQDCQNFVCRFHLQLF